MKVEFLLAHEDGTWTTEFIETPFEPGSTTNREDLMSWAEENLTRLTKYREIVLFVVYHY